METRFYRFGRRWRRHVDPEGLVCGNCAHWRWIDAKGYSPGFGECRVKKSVKWDDSTACDGFSPKIHFWRWYRSAARGDEEVK
jgi:hypothetical protein